MADIRTESVYVLYGSQTGNSEQAAKDFCEQIEEKFTPSYFESLKVDPVKVETSCMQLDDFLEYEHSSFTKTMIIFIPRKNRKIRKSPLRHSSQGER